MFGVLRDFPLLVLIFQVLPFCGSKAKLFLGLPVQIKQMIARHEISPALGKFNA